MNRRTRNRLVLPALAALLLAGCNPFASPEPPLVRKPEVLTPEIDAFARDTAREYSWEERFVRGNRETSLFETGVRVTRTGDTLIGATRLPRLHLEFDDGAARAASIIRLGLDPARVSLDSSRVPEPGPALAFPETPVIGWRIDTVVGALRFVRELRGVETLRQTGKRHETWAFAESTWWNDELVGTGSTWMGRDGLVRHVTDWPGFAPSASPETSGSLRREIRAR